jgi:hypothetical protein
MTHRSASRCVLRRTLLAGARETWFAPNVPLAPLFSRTTPHSLADGRKLGSFFLLDSALFVLSHSVPMINTTDKLASFWHFSLTTGSLPSDFLATILPPLATRHSPPATTSYDPPPLATACHRPPNCQEPNGPDLDERVLYFSMSPNQAIFTDKIIRSSPIAATHPLTVLSWPRCPTSVASGVPARWP